MLKSHAFTIAAASLMAGATALSGCAAQAGTIAPATDIRQNLAAYVAAHPYAALAIGVIDHGTSAIYTVAGPKVAQKLDDHSVFQIGSVTKTFTATALAEMAGAGEVSLDDPISKYLPPSVKAPAYNGTPITLLNLAEQNSGLPRLPADMASASPANPYAGYGTQQLYAFLSGYTLTRVPGAQYEYSNLGVGLLGQLLAARDHTTYPQLVAARIFTPLGMTGSTARGTPATRGSLIPGYASDGTPEAPWDFDALAACGSIESNLHDMLIYLRANMNPPNDALGQAMTLAQKPRVPIGLNGILQIGLIWQTNVRSGITWHNGQTGGYHAFVGFDKAGHGIVLLANVADTDLDTLAVHILAPYVPAPVETVHEPSPYAGVYPFSPGFSITIFKSGGKLFAQGTAQQPLELKLISGQTYATVGVDAQITFDVDAHGTATGLTLHQGGADQHAAKTAP